MIFRELERKQSIPLQLLISLGMKHLSLDSSKLGKRDEDCKEILDLAKAWYNVLEIEGIVVQLSRQKFNHFIMNRYM